MTKSPFVSRKTLDRAFETIGRWTGTKLKPLEDRIAKLEARNAVRHRGIWRDGKSYPEASLCTHSGSLWIAKRKTKARPGQSDNWQLVCKGGKPHDG